MGTFSALPMPVRTDENWRFASVKTLGLAHSTSRIISNETERDDLRSRSRGLDDVAGRMIFGNDQLLSHEPVSESPAVKRA